MIVEIALLTKFLNLLLLKYRRKGGRRMEFEVGTLVVERWYKNIGIIVGKEGGIPRVKYFRTGIEEVLGTFYLQPLIQLPEEDRELPLEKILEKYSERIIVSLALQVKESSEALAKIPTTVP
jgi:hypothetical protein